jgi:GNAT superfamily N-acetyltransferase
MTLAREYGEWARARAEADYGIVVGSEGEGGLSIDLDGLLDTRARLYVAEVGDDAVGIGGLKPLSGDAAEIKRMYVRPAGRGLGIGKALLRQLIDDARALGFQTLRLETTAFMPEAQALYRSFGFAATDAYEGREFADVPGAAEIQTFMALDLTNHDPEPAGGLARGGVLR